MVKVKIMNGWCSIHFRVKAKTTVCIHCIVYKLLGGFEQEAKLMNKN